MPFIAAVEIVAQAVVILLVAGVAMTAWLGLVMRR